MCKHILINNFQTRDIETLKAFAARSTNEKDGYGAIIRNKRGEFETLKDLDASRFYIALTERILRGNISTLVVHHRTSTNKPGIDYAHPFEFDGYLMTHNGVVSVPGVHQTRTENDSEALLHHLIKTGYETETVQGYFSCFILSRDNTTVLVDAIAPIYTDGRVYASHKLDDSWRAVQLKRLTLHPMSGVVMAESDIKVTESSYGQDSAHLSLGGAWDYPADPVTPERLTQNVREFFDLATDRDLEPVYFARSGFEARQLISELAYCFGLDVTSKEVSEIEDILETYYSSNQESIHESA